MTVADLNLLKKCYKEMPLTQLTLTVCKSILSVDTLFFEYLRCHEDQVVTPHTSHPNRYFFKNKFKFISLFQIAKDLGATLYLVNYAKKGTKHENLIKLMKVISVDETNRTSPVTTEEVNTTRQQFSEWFRKLNRECSII